MACICAAFAIPGNATAAGTQRVLVTLKQNTLLSAVSGPESMFTAPLPGATVARREALRSPLRRTERERQIAATMETLRNSKLGELRRAAAADTRASGRVERAIEQLGGKVLGSSPIPNAITAEIPRAQLAELRGIAGVSRVQNAPAPIAMSNPSDGSKTWWDAGFTGGGTSADGNGGPDYVAFDAGVRTTHQDFRRRMPGDPANGLGSGPSIVVSPAGRTNFGGSEHGNNIASIVASTNMTEQSAGSPPPPNPAMWPFRAGILPNIDKLYDPAEAQSNGRWSVGLSSPGGEPGVTDIPEAVNYSYGAYEDEVDESPTFTGWDSYPSNFGITLTVSAGNCGVGGAGYTGCSAPGDKHRVSSPANLYNMISVGGRSSTNPFDPTTYTPWPSSSPGPTWGGRKKPDLVASPAAGGCPTWMNDTNYGTCGQGTSNAAPQASAAALLLASSGVYSPLAQKSILINTAIPIQGQTYWTPRTGWGALNMGGTPQMDGSFAADGAFHKRGNYQTGSVSAVGANATRFYRQESVQVGDRTTVVWNRRMLGSGLASNYRPLTNIDLIQIDQSTGNVTATGGSDAADTVDTNQTVSADNPMPGNGADGGDNVEQVRSTATGTQIYKIKALSAVDGLAAEPFAIAGTRPVAALQTPIPDVEISLPASAVGTGEEFTVTANIENPSADLALSSASVQLQLPAGLSLVSGSATQSLGTLAAGGTTSRNWTVAGDTDGVHEISAQVTGTTYAEPFAGTGSGNVTVDGLPPALSVDGMPTWSTSPAPSTSWSASDGGSGVQNYDVEISRQGGAFTPHASATTDTSTSVAGAEGEAIALRIRARDNAGNVSDWGTTSTTIDAVPPVIALGAVSRPTSSSVSVPVVASNVGSPVSVRYAFGSSAEQPLTGSAATYANTTTIAKTITLRATAVDALGRAATASQTINVPSRYRTPPLRLAKIKARRGTLAIAGTVDRAYRGKITVRITRIGKQGTKRLQKHLSVRAGRFSAKLRVKRGRYRVSAITTLSGDLLAASTQRTARAK